MMLYGPVRSGPSSVALQGRPRSVRVVFAFKDGNVRASTLSWTHGSFAHLGVGSSQPVVIHMVVVRLGRPRMI
jgi:hypothetical protein